MHNNTYKSNNNASSSSNKLSSTSSMSPSTATANDTTMTRMHPSIKRPRAPIACYRCHHKKVRCDGIHPNCTRCLSTGVLCAYPSSRRSRNTQPTNVDPFIDNLSQLEARIRRIETDLESQRALVRTVCDSPSVMESNALTSRMLKTEKDLQESRSIVAQLRLRGEQRAARGRRAAAAASASSTTSAVGPDKNGSGKSNMKDAGQHTVGQHKRSSKLRVNSHNNSTKKDHMLKSPYSSTTATNAKTSIDYNSTTQHHGGGMTTNSPSPPFYFTQSDSSSPIDFINPSPNYYFPSSSSSTYDTTPICNSNFIMNDWPPLMDLQSTTTNGFVDPMILAAAAGELTQQAPLLSVSSCYMVDEETSIMAARARSLSHLPTQQLTIPGLQPSTSSTSTCSNNSSASFSNYTYDTSANASFTQFLDSAVAAAAAACGTGNNGNDRNVASAAAIMMMDQQHMR